MANNTTSTPARTKAGRPSPQGGNQLSTHDTQDGTVEAGSEVARRDDVELVTHSSDAKIRNGFLLIDVDCCILRSSVTPRRRRYHDWAFSKRSLSHSSTALTDHMRLPGRSIGRGNVTSSHPVDAASATKRWTLLGE